MTDITLEHHYAQLWQAALQSFRQGNVAIDRFLADKQHDQRRGFTLIIRPAQEVAQQFSRFLTDLASVEPTQYFYRPSEFHITVLALFTATEHYQPYFAQQAAYVHAVKRVLSTTHHFALRFHGITASPGAIMIQGFPQDDALDCMRNRLREQLRSMGLGDGLDQRYQLKTAHATVFRFQQQPENIQHFLQCLREYQAHDFGVMNVGAVQLVENDWYMSEDKVRVLKQYNLG